MIVPREQIYAALFTFGAAIKWTYNGQLQKWAYTSRKTTHWRDVPNQPAFIQRQDRERGTQPHPAGMQKWQLKAQWWIYLQAPNPDGPIAPSTLINAVVDAIDLSLGTPNRGPSSGPVSPLLYGMLGQPQTLASQNDGKPLVENVWIDGDIMEDDPVGQDSQIIIVVPISISTGM